MMSYASVLQQAKAGRPDLAALNAGNRGSLRLAALCAKYPHSSGCYYSARDLVTDARRTERVALRTHRGPQP